MGRAPGCTVGQVGLSWDQESGKQAFLRFCLPGVLGDFVSKACGGKGLISSILFGQLTQGYGVWGEGKLAQSLRPPLGVGSEQPWKVAGRQPNLQMRKVRLRGGKGRFQVSLVVS